MIGKTGNLMMSLNFTIRTMTRDEIDIAIDWTAQEGWNPGLYDAACFYAADPRGFFVGEIDNEPVATISAVKSWLNQPGSVALGIMQNGKLSGYGMVRVCRSGYKIGPLFADSLELAESLFISLKSQVKPGKPIYLDTPETNQDAIALAEKQNMKSVFETARMYKGVFPDLPLHRLFGVTTFELG